ncbi:YceI family protein [Ancylobacter sp. 6x-1]|uniref:YceI family protein n=1 Tax=Ancylobacter crimeensis TaxID=2579147 RepID=A0ABT0DED5_9HYPH|nr:YceI family protein [Ancylobacter crimeensis]MCK0198311.1 YceI family protein [Ancylobacter crimeensis]
MKTFAAPVAALASALLLAVAAPAGIAYAQQPGTADPAKISGGTYGVDDHHTQVSWTVNHFGISPLTGMFGKIGGSLTLDPAKPNEAKLDITIPMSGLVVTSADFGGHLASADFFDAAKFPDATFRSTKVEASGTTAKVTGDLTLHGVTRPVTLAVAFFGAGINPMSKAENIGFTATGSLKRSDFGMGRNVPVVSDEVELRITGAFAKK